MSRFSNLKILTFFLKWFHDFVVLYEDYLSVIVEHIFGVHDGNVEVLQISVDGDTNGLDVVGLNTFELFHKFFELLDCGDVVSGRDVDLVDIGFFMIRKYRIVGVG